MVNENVKQLMLKAQKTEITEHHIYLKLAAATKDTENKKILEHIARDEMRHYKFWKKHTKTDIEPNMLKVWWYFIISQILGLTFGIKLMEKGEAIAQKNYQELAKHIPEVQRIEQEEHAHEFKLIEMIGEKKLEYVGSMVLGLNDALVELTGAISGLTLAFQSTKIVGVAGLVTGIAASMSMAASEFLSTRAEGDKKDAGAAAFYTGIAYIITVFILIAPYFILQNPFIALTATIFLAIIIIFLFTYYMSIAKNYNFKKRFLEMALISLGVATLSFFIGMAANAFLGVN